jgi:uncharacterized lipoprotein NlpE involved in copper resistance
MKRSIMTVVIVVLIALIAFFVGCSTNNKKAIQTSFVGAEKHEVTLSDAVKFVQNFRKNPQTPKIQGGSFQRGILDKILAQPDCEGIRYYYAQNDDGTPTLVLVGITAKGSDMTKGTIAEKVSPCPPVCDDASELK